MQSKVASSTEAPIFRPSMAEFSNFKAYFKKIGIDRTEDQFCKGVLFIFMLILCVTNIKFVIFDRFPS